jgi:hypothetical protein
MGTDIIIAGEDISLLMRALSPEIKREESETDHSPPSNAKVKLYLYFPIRLHGVVHN